MQRRSTLLAASLAAASLTACASVDPPAQVENACAMLNQKTDWWRSLKRAERRWDAPPELVLAIIRQESAFTHDARPPRQGGFLFMPGKRPSDAYGYAQALESTWRRYQSETGRDGADRDSFEDASDFVGWYIKTSERQLGLRPTDYRNHYLAYHEGQGGYSRGTFRDKRWLLDVAAKVDRNARAYASQIKTCEGDLNGGWWIF